MAKTYTVSELNRRVKQWLENDVGTVSVTGELSNLTRPASGHLYFTLKDQNAQVRCALFRRSQNDYSKHMQNGDKVLVSGALSLYEQRGEYQLIARNIEPSGKGELLKQYLELKNKLQTEGLFDVKKKRPLPPFPQNIAVVTSATGAAFQDICTTIGRRYPVASIWLYPSDVQGALAPAKLCAALSAAYQNTAIDVLILGRGGGSMEDLQAFNEETLARMLPLSPFPIVTAVGHETDFTIVDFIADVRAPTPTGAAEKVTPCKSDIIAHLRKDFQSLCQSLNRFLQKCIWQLDTLRQRLITQNSSIQQAWQRVDRAHLNLQQQTALVLHKKQTRLSEVIQKLELLSPHTRLSLIQKKLDNLRLQLSNQQENIMKRYKHRLQLSCSMLHAVSPLATLDRGYSITTYQGCVLYNSHDVNINDSILITLQSGKLQCTVKETFENARETLLPKD